MSITVKLKLMKKRTYDVVFNDESSSNNCGFKMSKEDAKWFIKDNKQRNQSYFPDYQGGTVSIVCNETGETIYEEEI